MTIPVVRLAIEGPFGLISTHDDENAEHNPPVCVKIEVNPGVFM